MLVAVVWLISNLFHTLYKSRHQNHLVFSHCFLNFLHMCDSTWHVCCMLVLLVPSSAHKLHEETRNGVSADPKVTYNTRAWVLTGERGILIDYRRELECSVEGDDLLTLESQRQQQKKRLHTENEYWCP